LPKTDSNKLKDIMSLLKSEMKNIEKACDKDREYTSMGGNGCNASEARRAMKPIYDACLEIVNA